MNTNLIAYTIIKPNFSGEQHPFVMVIPCEKGIVKLSHKGDQVTSYRLISKKEFGVIVENSPLKMGILEDTQKHLEEVATQLVARRMAIRKKDKMEVYAIDFYIESLLFMCETNFEKVGTCIQNIVTRR